jgi:hypothetical protein
MNRLVRAREPNGSKKGAFAVRRISGYRIFKHLQIAAVG